MARSYEGHISNLVPHRGPMLLIDRLLEDTPELVRVESIVKPDQLFLTPEGLPAWVGIELMAQTVASWAGLRALAKHEPVKLGFLLGTRRYECARPFFPVGSRLEIEAREEMVGENGLAVFACRLTLKHELIATAQLNAFQPPNVEEYLRGNTHG
ncbi:MAG: hotdog family protein [Archangium sp.]|nr:hotdog family protein [Archangium sp.]MDP3571972.1 hotdog family protein [Archangium sp.]